MIGHKNNKTKGTNNAPIPEDNEQYCFRMPLKLEVHKRYWTTLLSGKSNHCSIFFYLGSVAYLTIVSILFYPANLSIFFNNFFYFGIVANVSILSIIFYLEIVTNLTMVSIVF